MSSTHPMSPDPAELFRWRAEAGATWTEAAGQASRLLAEVEAGRMDATPAELVALRTFTATVRGMTANDGAYPVPDRATGDGTVL